MDVILRSFMKFQVMSENCRQNWKFFRHEKSVLKVFFVPFDQMAFNSKKLTKYYLGVSFSLIGLDNDAVAKDFLLVGRIFQLLFSAV